MRVQRFKPVAALTLCGLLAGRSAAAQTDTAQRPVRIGAADTIGAAGGFVTVAERADGAVLVTQWTAAGPVSLLSDPAYAAAWVDSARALAAPGGSTKNPLYRGTTLSAGPISMRLLRLSADAAPAYRLTGAVTPFATSVDLSPGDADRLFSSLRNPPLLEQDSTRSCPPIPPLLAATLLPPLPASTLAGGICLQGYPDVDARTAPGSGGPRYPDAAQREGIQGRVLARFVVDETGRIDRTSIQFVTSSDARFTDAVRDFLEHATFTPALIGNRPVKQLTYEPFGFSLSR